MAQPLSAPPPQTASPSGTVSEFSGEVNKGQGFEKIVVGGLVFRLEPDAGGNSGWEIRLPPGHEPSMASMDCIGAVSEPLHGDNRLSVAPLGIDKDRDKAQWTKREFEFVPDPAACKEAWELANEAHYPSNLTDKQRKEAEDKLGKIPTSHGTFEITDLRLSPSASKGAPSEIEWLKFIVSLQFPTALEGRGASGGNSRTTGQSIRAAHVAKFLNSHYAELDSNLESLKVECSEGEDPIRNVDIQYGDLDGDGQEEALFQGYTCMAGTSGIDYSGIVKLQPDGKLVGLPITPPPDTFNGRKPLEGRRGHVRLAIEDGRLVEVFPVYKGDECEACSEGGQRKFVFRWNGQQFVLDDIINLPPDKAGN